MANIKSAKKRILVNRTKAARNKSIRSAVKTSIKKVEAAVQNNDKAAAQVALNEAIATISKATIQGCLPQKQLCKKSFPFNKSRKQHRLIKTPFIFNYKLIIKKDSHNRHVTVFFYVFDTRPRPGYNNLTYVRFHSIHPERRLS